MSLIILILAIFTSCGNSSSETAATDITEQTKNVEATIETDVETEDDQQMIVGKLTKEELMQEPYASWFKPGYENYQPSAEALETIKKNISEYEIIGFMGTWCGDSRREVPKFFKLLEAAGYDLSKLTMIGVDRSKTTPDNLQEGYDVTRVPTFIFMKDGKEVNRFVEYAQESLEEDVAKIVGSKEYSNSYAN